MIETISTEAGTFADTQAIEKELTQLWRQVGSAEKPMVRARVLSLVVVAEAARESEMVELLMQLADRHPARNLLLLLGGADEPERFEADATLLCRMRARLCAEQVRLHAAGAARGRLAGAVRTLLTSSLPVALWWTLPPDAEPSLWNELAPLADHVFWDSATLGGGERLRELPLERLGGRATDLNWGRLASWREIVAQFFDPSAFRPLLGQLDEVSIETGANPVGGWLLAGWLASRLGWTFERRERDTLQLRRPDGGEVRVAIQRGEGDAPLREVRLSAEGGDFQVRREGERSAECLSETEQGRPLQQLVRLRDEGEAAVVSRAMDRMARDRAAEEALTLARRMAGSKET